MDWRVNINGKEIGMSYEEYEQMLEDNLSDKYKQMLENSLNEYARVSNKWLSNFNEPVYSATYDNGGWPERDSLPTGDPHGDVDEPKVTRVDTGRYRVNFNDSDFYKNMKKRCINPEGKYDGPSKFDPGVSIKLKTCCESPQKYKNVISKNLQFYSCKNCGADLGDC